MSALFSRFVLAGVFLALVAAVVTTTGAGVFGGSLGSLFGYHEHLAASERSLAWRRTECLDGNLTLMTSGPLD